jgi:hypothetical protein
VLGSNRFWDTGHPGFRGVPESLQTDARIVPRLAHILLLPNCFPVRLHSDSAGTVGKEVV